MKTESVIINSGEPERLSWLAVFLSGRQYRSCWPNRPARGTSIALLCLMETGESMMGRKQTGTGVNMVDLVEEMLFQRASTGIRPALYISSYTDLECSMLMLLEDSDEVHWSGHKQPAGKQLGYDIIIN